jgi:hypothetical protein
VLGTFSAGKSTFINHHLCYPLQDTGNQAVDDKFTVVCYSGEKEVRVLPGLALDADPRFPFYQTSEELDKVAPGEGRRIDSYLQLKTCNCAPLKGRIFIDSPGFDADAQRSATLRLTNHIIDLSDLVLVFFDARHPEPGAMSDTLSHLVRDTIARADSSKFLYILNQIDTTAREDNPEEVVGAWQRALAREGLTAGRFYCIYNPEAAVPIEDPALKRRFEWKRDQDMEEILVRIDQVSVERCYRIIGALEKRAQEIEEVHVPRLRGLIGRWRRRVLRTEGILLGLAALVGLALWLSPLQWPQWLPNLSALMDEGNVQHKLLAAAIAAALLLYGHFTVRKWSARAILKAIAREYPGDEGEQLQRAFRRNIRIHRSIFEPDPAGWTRWNRKRLRRVVADADHYVQTLNDRFTDPSGKKSGAPKTPVQPTLDEVEPEPEVVTGEVIPRASTSASTTSTT